MSRGQRRLRQILALGIPQGTLAESVGAAQQTISSLATGRTKHPDLVVAVRFARTWRIPVDWWVEEAEGDDVDLPPSTATGTEG